MTEKNKFNIPDNGQGTEASATGEKVSLSKGELGKDLGMKLPEGLRTLLWAYITNNVLYTKELLKDGKVMLGNDVHPAEVPESEILACDIITTKGVRFETVGGEEIAVVDLEVNGEEMVAFQVPEYYRDDIVRTQLGAMVRDNLSITYYDKEWLILGKDLVKKNGRNWQNIASYDPERKTDIVRELAKKGFSMLTLEDLCVLAEISSEILKKPIGKITRSEMKKIGLDLQRFEFGCQDGKNETVFLRGGGGTGEAGVGVFTLDPDKKAINLDYSVGFRAVI